jgi:hypothetical protein
MRISKFTTTMKILLITFMFVMCLVTITGCHGNSGNNANVQPLPDSLAVPDTGYTGIKKYMSGQYLIKEITFRNGVREGVMKSFYQSGKLRQSFIYRNNIRQDSSIWFYEEGQVFRITPYINDTIEGIQKQYYRDGKLKARIGYRKGFRTTFFEEFTKEGKRITGYPDIMAGTKDSYNSNGIYSITLQLSNNSQKVRFYRGDFYNGVFDTTRVARIKTVDGTAKLNLKKTGKTGPEYVGVIAEILTGFGNNYLVYKKITLPYGDLN